MPQNAESQKLLVDFLASQNLQGQNAEELEEP